MFKRNNFKSINIALVLIAILGLLSFFVFENCQEVKNEKDIVLSDLIDDEENGIFIIVDNHRIESKQIDNDVFLVVVPSIANQTNSMLYYNSQKLKDFLDYIGRDYEIDGIKIRLIKLENTKTIFINFDKSIELDYDTTDIDTSFTIYNELNKLVYYSKEKDKLSVRGNTTAYNYKKPFTIELSKKIKLSEISKSKKFTLLANAFDKSNLRNKLIYDLAREVGLKGTPNLEYIDVFINGHYEGLYTISNNLVKECESTIINNENDILFAVESYVDKDVVISTDGGVDIRVRCPKNESQRTIDVINQFEAFVFSITKDYWPKELDLDSFVNKYLIDEVFGNYEADYRSSYYYYNSSENKFYAGPIWDYDLSMSNPVIDDKNHKRYDIDYGTYRGKYYRYFLNNESFNKKIEEYYQDIYLNEIENVIPKKINNLNITYKNSLKANDLTWGWMYYNLVTEDIDPIYFGNYDTTKQLLDYLENRKNYLDKLWLNE